MERVDVFLEPLRAFLLEIGAFLPRLGVAVLVLLAGFLIAKAARFAIEKGLRSVNFHIVTQRSGLDGFLHKGGTDVDTIGVLRLAWMARRPKALRDHVQQTAQTVARTIPAPVRRAVRRALTGRRVAAASREHGQGDRCHHCLAHLSSPSAQTWSSRNPATRSTIAGQPWSKRWSSPGYSKYSTVCPAPRNAATVARLQSTGQTASAVPWCTCTGTSIRRT